MIYSITFIIGMAVGSLINAFVWRHKKNQDSLSTIPISAKRYSILNGRSVCTHCETVLSPRDLVPVVSWLLLRGKCRYCHEKIEDNPIAEIVTAVLFLVSYLFWPYQLNELIDGVVFLVWLTIVFLLVFLFIYDLRWMLLPDRFVLAFTLVVIGYSALVSFTYHDPDHIIAALVGGASVSLIFFALYYFSGGRWVGGGDVKLLFGLGMLSGSFFGALIMVFIASLLGTLLVLPKLLLRKLSPTHLLPFGPLLIAAAFVVFFYVNNTNISIVNWLIVS